MSDCIARLRVPFLAAVLLLTAAVRPSWSAAFEVDCEHPFVFSDAAVNLVVLPYAYAGASAAVRHTGRRLAILAQLDTLLAILKYGNVAAISVTTPIGAESECTPDSVVDKLIGKDRGAESQVKTRKGLVVLWGRLYEENDRLYVQSFARFLRRDVANEGLELRIGDRMFVGHVSATSFSFAARSLTTGDLDRIERRFTEAFAVHSQPDTKSPSEPIHITPDSSFPLRYAVTDVRTDVRGSWMRLTSNGPGPSGWVLADDSAAGWSLRRQLPELIFIEGLVGYLTGRAEDRPDVASRRQTFALAAMRQSLEQFNETKTALRAFAPLALAVGQQLLGLLQWNSALPGQREQARSLFEDAARTVPYSADARNLEIASRLFLAYQQPGAVASAPAILNDLQSAVALAPQNAEAASNLANFLELVSADTTRTNRRLQVALTPADLRQQLAILRQVRPAGATSNPQ